MSDWFLKSGCGNIRDLLHFHFKSTIMHHTKLLFCMHLTFNNVYPVTYNIGSELKAIIYQLETVEMQTKISMLRRRD